MKRILFIMTTLGGGGAEKVLLDILRNFDYGKYQVDLLLTTGDGLYTQSVDEHVKKYILYPTRFAKYLRRVLLFLYRKLNCQWLLRMYIRGRIVNEYDVIISFMEGEPLLLQSCLFDKGKKNISWIHTDFYVNHWTGWLHNEIQLYNQLDNIVFVSELTKQQFYKKWPIVTTQGIVIYNLIDADYIRDFIQAEIPLKRGFTICTVGRLNIPKRYDRLINVAMLMKQRNFDGEIWLLGEGPLQDHLQKQAEQLGVADMVRFLGFITPPYAVIKQADIFVSTSEVEGFPLVLCEALCLGLPIVATNTAGAVELLGNSEYGVVVEQNEEDICKALMQLYNDAEQCSYYAHRAIKRAQMFDVETTMDKIYDLL